MSFGFNYRLIGESLLRELTELLRHGDSAVLLGVRELGKSYVLSRLAERLQDRREMIVIALDFPHEPSLATADDIREFLHRAVLRTYPDFANTHLNHDSLLGEIQSLCEDRRGPVVLLVGNVDSLAHHQAQRFLRETRQLVEESSFRFGAILTGEEDLRDLVHGPASEFNCAEQYLLQGFDEEEFLAYAHRRQSVTHTNFTDVDSSHHQLYHESGGNIHLARAALWAWLEYQARHGMKISERVTTDDFAKFLATFPAGSMGERDVFHHTTRVIHRSPESWSALELMLNDRVVPTCDSGDPHPLELAGLATRESGALRFASPIMRRFARMHFDQCRLGDLYAVHGDWAKAFLFYKRLKPDRTARPCGADDRVRLGLVVKSLIAALHAEATRKIDARKVDPGRRRLTRVKRLFARGCRVILGVSEVTFWTYRGEWRSLNHREPAIIVANFARSLLEGATKTDGKLPEPRWYPVAPPDNQHAALAILTSVRPDQRDAVVVSDVQSPVAISREREELLHELLDQFAIAYDHIIANWGTRLRLEARRQHLGVATEIVNALGSTVRDPHQALKRAGDALLELRFRRIMFSLVDAADNAIHGRVNCAKNPKEADVAGETHYSRSESQRDIQAWVVNNRRPCVVPDWRKWDSNTLHRPAINRDLCNRANMGPFAVVPMFITCAGPDGTREEKIYGTIHVERADWMVPSEQDLEDLEEFGRQLAAAANQAERTDVLLKALEEDQDSVVILDRQGLVSFANPAAASRLKIPSGWHEPYENISLDSTNHHQLHQNAIDVLTKGKAAVHHNIISDNGQAGRETVNWKPLRDWRTKELTPTISHTCGLAKHADDECVREQLHCGCEHLNPTMGALLRIRDLTGLHQAFLALEEIAQHAANRETTIQAVVEALRGLGHESARLYLCAAHDPRLLISAYGVGIPDEKDAAKFNQGGFQMSELDSSSPETWECLHQRQARIYCWQPDKPDGAECPTAEGLPASNLTRPKFSVVSWKKPGNYWIDLPLCTRDQTVGKLTLECPAGFKPEQFEALNLFSALLGALLQTVQRLEHSEQEKQRLEKRIWVEAAAEKAIATAAHNVRNKLGGLGGFSRRYEVAAPQNSEVLRLNNIYQPIIDGCYQTVARIKDTLSHVILHRKLVDLEPLLRSTLEGAFVSHPIETFEWKLICPSDLRSNIDPDRLRNAFEEMLQNSCEFAPVQGKLEIEVSVEPQFRGEQRWLAILVRDNGLGIPNERHESIFEAFASNRPQGERSTGLGLNFVRRVIEAHGGRVSVVKSAGPGSAFLIEIPA